MSPEMEALQELSECDWEGAGEDKSEEEGRPGCSTYFAEEMRKAAGPQEPRRQQEAIAVLNLKLQVNALSRQIQKLSRRVSKLEELPGPLVVPINTFAPKPFEPIGQLLVLVEPVVDESGEPCEHIATFPDAGIGATGDTVVEAVSLLKDRMVTEYNLLANLPSERLGKIPRQQLVALQAVMRKVE